MAIDLAEARRIAELARLEIPEAELEVVARQLSQVLDFVATLDRLELGDGEATVLAPAGQPLRADVPDGRTLTAEAALANAPEAEHGFFLVPPVVDHLEP
jgi:aspartyl-tRNA(Asn)/glutamyl-tRNA(Gln) amidotransferase subunit C